MLEVVVFESTEMNQAFFALQSFRPTVTTWRFLYFPWITVSRCQGIVVYVMLLINYYLNTRVSYTFTIICFPLIFYCSLTYFVVCFLHEWVFLLCKKLKTSVRFSVWFCNSNRITHEMNALLSNPPFSIQFIWLHQCIRTLLFKGTQFSSIFFGKFSKFKQDTTFYYFCRK